MGPAPGAELLFLHPLPFDGDMWAPFESDFGDLATCAPTLYPLGTRLEEVAEAVLDLVDGDRLIVVGNSIGGLVALEVVAAAPDRVEQLVLIGTKAGHRPEPDYRDWALDLLASGGVDAVWSEVWEPLFSPTTDRSVVDAAKAKALTVPSDHLAGGIAMFHGRRDLNHVIDGWSKPLTVVTGGHDSTPGRRVAEEMVSRSRRGILQIVPDCGHYVPLEQQAALAAIIEQSILGRE